MTSSRVIAWFSCGAASAVSAKLAIEKFGADRVSVVYCDTSKNEHPDNRRFMSDIQRWIGVPVMVIGSKLFTSIEEVFEKRKYMSGIAGAVCTVEMKKVPRFKFQRADDIHVFGLTADEQKRIRNFTQNNPELELAWLLRDAGVTKRECFSRIVSAGITLPVLYQQGYRNNNCIGCVKATSAAYWGKVRDDYPSIFDLRAKQSRALGVRLVRFKGKRIFLDELPLGAVQGRLENVTCGPECHS